jgi:hypothetical protein
MIKHEDNKLFMELPWDMVELIVRDTLKTDIEMYSVDESDIDLLDALQKVYQYYGGNLNNE